jgi:uncharacterized protein YwgA
MRLKQELKLKDIEFIIDKKNARLFSKTKPEISGSDLILVLLSISPIKGNTKLQKQVFLAWKEIFNDKICELGYYPYKFGAYSRLIEDSAKLLVLEDKISVEKRRGEGTIYAIREKGQRSIRKNLIKNKTRWIKLRDRKTDWDDWSPKGILRYVYRNYPQYATKTKIPSLKW